MMRSLVTGTAAMALCLASATSAVGQDYRFAGFDGPRGMNATIRLHIPFGASSERSRPTLALTVAAGRTLGDGTDGEPIVRQVRLVDFRFSSGGLASARVAAFDLANLDENRRLYLGLPSGKKTTAYLVAGAAAAAAAACLILGCLDDDDSDDSPGDDAAAPTPG